MSRAGALCRRDLAGRFLAMAATASAAAVIPRAFDGPAAYAWAAAGLLPPFLVSAWQSRSRSLPLLSSVTAALGLFTAVGAVLVWASPARNSADLVRGLVDGVIPLLNRALPLPADPNSLIVPAVLVFVAAVASAESSSRGDGPLIPLIPALVLLTAGIALTAPLPGTNVAYASLFTLAAAAFIAHRRTGRPVPQTTAGVGRSRTSTSLFQRIATPFVVLILAGTGLAVESLPWPGTRVRYDPRDDLRHELDAEVQTDPLSLVAKWLAEPDRTLFRARQSQAVPWQNWRLIALDDFDGRDWGLNRRFLPTGRHIPGQPGRPGTVSEQTIEIADLDGVLLPSAERPVEVDGVDLAVDTETATLLSTEPVTGELSYTVRSVRPVSPAPADTAKLTPATDAPAASLTSPAAVPAVLERLAEQAGTAGNPYERARRLQQNLRTNWEYNPKATSGHSLGSVRTFLETPRAQGTSVVFATTFALAARRLGMPSRIVVGFTPGTSAVAGTEHEIRSGDVVVWPEIKFAGAGWLPFYPTPQTSSLKEAPGLGETAPPDAGTPPPETGNDEHAAGPDAPTDGLALPEIQVAELDRDLRRLWTGMTAAVVVLLVAYLALSASGPARLRRRRRKAPDPRRRVLGAWHDTIDELCSSGVTIPRSATPNQINELGGTALRREQKSGLSTLTALATLALFAEAQPSETDADRAWAKSDELRSTIRQRMSRAVRIRRMLVPAKAASVRSSRRGASGGRL